MSLLLLVLLPPCRLLPPLHLEPLLQLCLPQDQQHQRMTVVAPAERR
jgi:hypothetical protein